MNQVRVAQPPSLPDAGASTSAARVLFLSLGLDKIKVAQDPLESRPRISLRQRSTLPSSLSPGQNCDLPTVNIFCHRGLPADPPILIALDLSCGIKPDYVSAPILCRQDCHRATPKPL